MSFALTVYTLVHVAISLVAIAAGIVVVAQLLAGKLPKRWTMFFLATTVATSVTGFGFPFERFLPSHGFGVLSLVALAIAIYALYARHLVGAWRWVYVIGAVVALYFNIFVLVVQLFLKVPALKALAPTQSEPPFAITQLAVLVLFGILGVLAVIRFRPAVAGSS